MVALPMLVMGQSGHPLQPQIPAPKAPAALVPKGQAVVQYRAQNLAKRGLLPLSKPGL